MTQAHPHDDPHASQGTPGATHDPVCGHWVVPAKARGTTTIDGATIHFCSERCKVAFDRDPQRFLPRWHRSAPATSYMQHEARSKSMGMLDKMKVQAAPPPPGSAQDPVCHMKVDPARAAGKSVHDGTTYYFCSGSCKSRFDADPKKYLTSSGPHSM